MQDEDEATAVCSAVKPTQPRPTLFHWNSGDNDDANYGDCCGGG